MSEPPRHLPGIECRRIRSDRLETQVLLHGPADGEGVLFLHGNLGSGTFWEETVLSLPDRFLAAAPDQRGYGQSDPAAEIDATRGVADWVDDAVALADALGWDRFHLAAHSLGGCVAWGLLGEHSERLRSVALMGPGPPCGFGGVHGLRGDLNHPDGAGSGAGLVQPELVRKLREGDHGDGLLSPRSIMNQLYWKPPFRPAREEDLLAAMFQVHLGERQFPGDATTSPHWPGFAPGRCGPINAISPLYNQDVLAAVESASHRPPLLWVRGADDLILSDGAVSDAGYQGQIGLRPNWPGAEVFPPQPMLQQVTYALDRYEQAGGRVARLMLPNVGHTPYLERPTEVHAKLIELLEGRC